VHRQLVHPQFAIALAWLSAACALTSHPSEPAKLGVARSSDALVAGLDQPGDWQLESVNSADWSVDRGGLINLKHGKAIAAKLADGLEPIQIYFHALRHPQHGLFIVDTGVDRALRDDPEHAALSGGLVGKAMGIDRMRIKQPLADYLEHAGQPLRGVFLTHLHADHISGVPDVPREVPIYAGFGETSARSALNVVVRPITNTLLSNHGAVQELKFSADAAQRFQGVIDVFGDGSFWALSVPGHTPGSVAYLARTTKGPVLMTGDTCHTAWGWLNEVEPGSFTEDQAQNRDSLLRLRRLVREHPALSVRLGHQTLPADSH
jgi:glyoxylase-like metal-dependent hydrolase (beta-lactamase superfamily II)